MKILKLIILLAICNQVFSQETFPLNGVAKTFDPTYAFKNATIVSAPGIILKNRVMLIQEFYHLVLA